MNPTEIRELPEVGLEAVLLPYDIVPMIPIIEGAGGACTPRHWQS